MCGPLRTETKANPESRRQSPNKTGAGHKDLHVHREERPGGHTGGSAAAAGALTAPHHWESCLRMWRMDLQGKGEKETHREKKGRGEKEKEWTVQM